MLHPIAILGKYLIFTFFRNSQKKFTSFQQKVFAGPGAGKDFPLRKMRHAGARFSGSLRLGRILSCALAQRLLSLAT
ncbi:MAG: hypothetical protein L0Z70_09105 [Chloroflexi bacterium]|nr:hypothetical protein [Chloroflexota bacterium]